jgi:hypothetical protein
MSDTVELLETIGRDASLRWASPDDLMRALDELNASEGLRVAVASGEKGSLLQELGQAGKENPVVNHNTPDGGCDPDMDDPEDGSDDDDKTDTPRPSNQNS